MLANRLEFAPDRDAEVYSAIPASPAVFLLRGADLNSEPYISKTANLRRRIQRLLGPRLEASRGLNLRNRVAAIEYTSTGSDFESGFLLYQLLRSAFPKTYSGRLRLRFAPVIKLHLENQFPRSLGDDENLAPQRALFVLWSISFTRDGRKVCQRYPRLLQNAPLP